MKATRNWGPCACNCGRDIQPGDEFSMIEGAMYLRGHDEKATRNIPAVRSKSGKSKNAARDKDLSDLPLFGGMT